MKFPTLQPRTSWRLPDMSRLPSWAGASRVSVDVETRDPELTTLGPGVRRGTGRVVGVSYAIEDGPGGYLPFGHAIGPNLDREAVFAYLRDQSRAFKGDVVGANLQYDMDYLAEDGVEFWHCRWLDVQVIAPLLDELQMSYSLENIAKRAGIPGKSEDTLRAAAAAWGVDPKSGLWQLPSSCVGEYAEQDTRLPLRLVAMQEKQIEAEDLRRVFDLETRLQPVLLKLRRRGVRVDFDRLEQVETWSRSREVAALSEITRATGIHLSTEDTNRTSALVPVIRHLGFPVPKTAPSKNHPNGQDSLTKDYLETLKHPVADMIRAARKFNKLRTTFGASIREHAVKGRIHCTFNQVRVQREGDEEEEGARYGRLSCVDPNLQQQPARDPEIGKRWRSIYLPDEGGQWVSCDYSQQEPRWLTHYAELDDLPKAREAAERYRTDPSTDNHQMMADLCQIERKPAKEIYLGLCYGMGGAKLCRKLKLPTKWMVKFQGEWLEVSDPVAVRAMKEYGARKAEVAGPEGKALLDKFDEGAPFVRMLSRRLQKSAERRGWIRTAGGRKCRFPRKADGSFDWAHKGLNRLIQGSSGDQTKAAMIAADAAGIALQLQVHDELDLTVSDRSEAEALAEVMRNALPCNVPAKVDIEMGPSWGEAT